jgi:hypothetical protein
VKTSQKEKEDFIYKLLEEGRPYRDITQIAHCSPNEIARIRRKMTADTTKTDLNVKSKSICSLVFESLQKGTPLPQIIIDHDIEPEQVIKIQEKYLDIVGKGKIISLLKEQKNLSLIINIVEFLVKNPHHLKKITDLRDLQREIWDLMSERDEIREDVRISKCVDKHYDSKLELKRKKILTEN